MSGYACPMYLNLPLHKSFLLDVLLPEEPLPFLLEWLGEVPLELLLDDCSSRIGL